MSEKCPECNKEMKYKDLSGGYDEEPSGILSCKCGYMEDEFGIIKKTMELKKFIDSIFTRKAKEHNLKSGDLTPQQHFSLNNYIEGIEKIISEWIEQNKG